MGQSALAAVSIAYTCDHLATSARVIDIPCGCGNPLEELCGEDCDGCAVEVELEDELAPCRGICGMLPVGLSQVYVHDMSGASNLDRVEDRENERWTCTYPYIGPGLCDCVCCGSPSRWGFPAPVPGAGGHPSLCAGFMIRDSIHSRAREKCSSLWDQRLCFRSQAMPCGARSWFDLDSGQWLETRLWPLLHVRSGSKADGR